MFWLHIYIKSGVAVAWLKKTKFRSRKAQIGPVRKTLVIKSCNSSRARIKYTYLCFLVVLRERQCEDHADESHVPHRFPWHSTHLYNTTSLECASVLFNCPLFRRHVLINPPTYKLINPPPPPRWYKRDGVGVDRNPNLGFRPVKAQRYKFTLIRYHWACSTTWYLFCRLWCHMTPNDVIWPPSWIRIT